MEIKVPREIKVGTHRVRIFYEPRLMSNHGKMAQARLNENEIAIEPAENAESHKATQLLHELLHYIDHIYNNYQLNEQQTDALSNGIAILLDELGVKLDFSDIKEAE